MHVGLKFQHRVGDWAIKCFGAKVALDTQVRNFRFLEEALELVQTCGLTREQTLRLVDYVYERAFGDVEQEVGGVMVSLAALCNAQGVDTLDCAETEYDRIITPHMIERIRLRQVEKPNP